MLASLFGVLLLAACSSSGSTSSAASETSSPVSGGTASAPTGAAADTIVIKNFMFSPSSLTVAPGATVTVKNEDTVTHTLTDKSSASVFNTGDIAPGRSKTFNAPNKPGNYPYICSIHQYMTGTLVVR